MRETEKTSDDQQLSISQALLTTYVFCGEISKISKLFGEKKVPTVLLTSFGKTFFIRRFILNGKKDMLLTIFLSETICRFHSCACL